MRVKNELQRRRITRYGAVVSGTEMSAQQRRARAIWGFSGMEQAELAERAGVDQGRLKAWLGKRKANPSLDELYKLATAAGVPRQFVERGFEDLLEPIERLQLEIKRLQDSLEEVQLEAAARVLEVEKRLDAIEKQA